MNEPTTPSPRGYRYQSYDSPMSALYPLAQSTAIKHHGQGNSTYAIPRDSKSASTHTDSVTILDLHNLPMNLMSNSITLTPNMQIRNQELSSKVYNEDEEHDDQVDVQLDADELRKLEEAFGDLTGAITTVTVDRKCFGSDVAHYESTNLSSSSFPSDQPVTNHFNANESKASVDENENLLVSDQENEVPEYRAPILRFPSSDHYSYGRSLSTILECQSRESFSGDSKHTNDLGTTAEFLRLERDSGGMSEKSKLPILAQSHSMPRPRKSYSFRSNKSDSLGESRQPLSDIKSPQQNDTASSRVSQRSAIFGAGDVPFSALIEFSDHPEVEKSSLLRLKSLDVSSLQLQSDAQENAKPVATARSAKRLPVDSVPPLDLSTLHTSDNNEETAPADETIDNLLAVTKSPPDVDESSSYTVSLDLGACYSDMRTSECTTVSLERSAVVVVTTQSSGVSPASVEPTIAEAECASQTGSGSSGPRSRRYFIPPAAAAQVLDNPFTNSDSTKGLMTDTAVDGVVSDPTNCSQVILMDGGGESSSPTASCGSTGAACGQEVVVEEPSDNNWPHGQLCQTSPSELRRPGLLASSRCLFWRAGVFGHESKETFILRHESNGILQVKLDLSAGADVFTVLDHRGNPPRDGSRIINLPPHLSCAVTIVYKPKTPALWHTGVLSLHVRPSSGSDITNPDTYLIRLIGYVGSSSLECSLCCCVDNTTYWTSAFSAPTDDQVVGSRGERSPSPPTTTAAAAAPFPLSVSPDGDFRDRYAARVVLTNSGLRSAWVLAVARRRSNASGHADDFNLARVGQVTIRPESFVIEPDKSQEVTISLESKREVVEILFYSGDEILRYQCRKLFTRLENPPAFSPPSLLPRLHQRLRSAYILQAYDEESGTISSELPPSISVRLYDWHTALRDEQRTRPPISLMVYSLLAEEAGASFESSCSFFAQLGDAERSLLTPGTLVVDEGEGGSLNHASPLSACHYQRLTSIRDWIRQAGNPSPSFSNQKKECARPPVILLKPDSDLIFAPCSLGLYTSATLTIELQPVDEFGAITTATTTSTPQTSASVRYRPRYIWRLHWTASPLSTGNGEAEGEEGGVFRCLIGNHSDTTLLERSDNLPISAVGGTHHLPFVFRAPRISGGNVAPNGNRVFSQEWRFVFRLTRESNPTKVCSQQEFIMRLRGETLKPAPPLKSVSPPPIASQRSFLKIHGNPSLFDDETRQRQIDLVNLSRDDRLCIRLGIIECALFEMIKPVSRKFMINARSSVRLIIRYLPQTAGKRTPKTSASLPITWALSSSESDVHHVNLELKAFS